jgi:hypothetical protein
MEYFMAPINLAVLSPGDRFEFNGIHKGKRFGAI